jgi:hypothetical protein
MYGILLAVSPERRDQLRRGDRLLRLLVGRHTSPVEHMLDLGNAWKFLDAVLSNDGADSLLGDAVIGRSGAPFGPSLAYEPPRLLGPERVREIEQALDAVSLDVLAERMRALPREGAPPTQTEERAQQDEADRRFLARMLEALRAFYRDAAARGDAVLTIVT